MRKYIFGILVSFFFVGHNIAQTILISTTCQNSIETLGDVLIDGNSIELDNTTISCNTITFGNSVSELKIKSTVKIKCKNIILEASTESLKLKKSSGILIIEYLDKFDDNKRKFEIVKGSSLQLKFANK